MRVPFFRSLAFLLALAACGSDSTGSSAPANVVVVSATKQETDLDARATVHLRNDGGPAAFQVQFWGGPRSPGGADILYGASDPVEVSADYDETITYTVTATGITLGWLIVLSRDQGSAALRQTDRYDF